MRLSFRLGQSVCLDGGEAGLWTGCIIKSYRGHLTVFQLSSLRISSMAVCYFYPRHFIRGFLG